MSSCLDATTSSVSKGCFVIRPAKSSRKRTNTDDSHDRFPDVQGECVEHRVLRHDTYTNTWSEIEKQVNTLQSNLNKDVFAKIVNLVSGSAVLNMESRTAKHEIFTGALITGVNMPDHEAIFAELTKELVVYTPYVTRLCSKNCPNLKTLLKECTMPIIESVSNDDEDSQRRAAPFLSRKGNLTMEMFYDWYKLHEGVRCAKLGRSTCDPIVFIFEDFESFQPAALQDFITICSLYVDPSRFPIVLLFGIATIPAIVHKLLPHSVSSLLHIEKYHAQPAITSLLEVIHRVLINAEFPFKLGPKVFQFLYENFLFHDFSLQNFIVALKFCMIDHFYTNPLSVLCQSGAGTCGNILAAFSHEQLEMVRKCSSFQMYAEAQSRKDLRRLLTDDQFTKEIVSDLLDDVRSYHNHFFPVLRCLTLLVIKLPGYPLGKKCRDVYEWCLKSNIKDVESYENAMKIAGFLAKDELVPVLQDASEILRSALEESDDTCEDFAAFIEDLDEAVAGFDELSRQAWDTTRHAESSLQQSAVPTTAKTSRFELQEKLKNAMYQKKKDSPFEKSREAAIATLDKLFQRYLLCPAEIPLYEVFYYDAIETVKQRLSGCPRVGIQTALNNPRYYLNCACCNIEPGAIQDTLPDISIAFKLHLECGRLINLYDWLQAFLTVTEPPDDSSKDKLDNLTEQELHARFIQAVSELQFLGFIKATKKKTDHVARLTWGNC